MKAIQLMLASLAIASTPTLGQTVGATVFTVADFADLDSDIASNPQFGVTIAPDGTIYGVTRAAGLGYSVSPNGVVYKVSPNTTVPLPLATLVSPWGALPQGPLVRTADGFLYGTTYQGGVRDWGTVFSVAPDGTLTTLHDFGLVLPANPDKASRHPSALILGSDGSLYGTTRQGGTHFGGTVFRITTQGAVSTVHEFSDATVDPVSPDAGAGGWTPTAPLALGRDGSLYGTTDGGGANRWGTVFRINQAGEFLKVVDLGAAQARPGPLVEANDGRLYGISGQGGDFGTGAVFAADVSTRSVTNIYSGCFDSNSPHRLVQGGNGYLYGTITSRCVPSVFRVSLSGEFQILSDVAATGPLLETSRGVFLGTASGGRARRGIVFRLVDGSATPSCAVTAVTTAPALAGVELAAQFRVVPALSPECGTLQPAVAWSFGDNTPPGTKRRMAHTYKEVGEYRWSVTVKVAGGGEWSSSGRIKVVPTFRLSGTVGVWDGTAVWPFDGPGVNRDAASPSFTITARSVTTLRTYTARTVEGRFEFATLPEDWYWLSSSRLTYDQDVPGNVQSCAPFSVGSDGRTIKRTVPFAEQLVNLDGDMRADFHAPLPLVLVHGYGASFEKWQNWSDAANRAGFITITPNYNSLVYDNWEAAADQVLTQLQVALRGLTTAASAERYPSWVLVGHSQGGLIARVISIRMGGAAASLRKIYVLGTPNSGALEGVAELSCADYLLARNGFLSRFNASYPNFGAVDVVGYAGDRFGGVSDGLVSVESVFNIVRDADPRPEIQDLAVTQALVGARVGYGHTQLGGKASRQRILTDEILPQVKCLTSECLVSITGGVEVSLYNVDDMIEVFVNGAPIESATVGNGRTFSIDPFLVDGDNLLEFRVSNVSGGWTYGWNVLDTRNLTNDGRSRINEACGRAGEEGCHGDDQTTGIVYVRRYVLRK